MMPGPEPIATQLPEVYALLRRLAHRYVRREPRAITIEPTALVHEAYLRLARQARRLELARADLLKAAAGAMRLALVDHARRRRSAKRGRGARVDLDQAREPEAVAPGLDLLAIDEALERLRAIDPELTRIVELRFHGGLAESEIARVLGLSARSVRRGWRLARAWLKYELAR